MTKCQRISKLRRINWLVPLFLLLQLRYSWADYLSVSATTLSNPCWNPPIRIGVQSKRSNRAVLASTATTRQYSPPRSTSTWNKGDLFSTEEEEEHEDYFSSNGLIHESEESSHATSAIISRSSNTVDQSTGFRNSYTIPSRIRTTEEIAYDKSTVVPCAAVAVSTKGAATFTPNVPFAKGGIFGKKSQKSKKEVAAINNNDSQQQSTTSVGPGRALMFWENMVCGAISRSLAQTIMHPANTMKTILQQSGAPAITSLMTPQNIPMLMRGAGANFILSVPHGAVNFAVLEMVRKELTRAVQSTTYLREREHKIGPALDFMSSAISTICCSVVSTPQMMITDNIMAGNYPNLAAAIKGLAAQGKGLSGFYARGWWPGLAGKIPSYALTWTFFQQLKVARKRLSGREATNAENSIMGCLASGTTVCIMIPVDTIKTRLVTQASRAATNGVVPYKGIFDCAIRVAKEEGIKSFYRGLPPRLISVVPMIGIQFGVYEFMKKAMQRRALATEKQPKEFLTPTILKKPDVQTIFKQSDMEKDFDPYSSMEILEEAAMEVAASPEHPYPAPHFLKRLKMKNGKNGWRFNFWGNKDSVPVPSNP